MNEFFETKSLAVAEKKREKNVNENVFNVEKSGYEKKIKMWIAKQSKKEDGTNDVSI